MADTNRNVERRQDPASEANPLRGRVFGFCLPIPNQQDEEDRAHDQHDHDGREDDEAAGDEDVGVGHVTTALASQIDPTRTFSLCGGSRAEGGSNPAVEKATALLAIMG